MIRNKFAVELRSKANPENTIKSEEIFVSGGFVYKLHIDFAKWPEQYKGYQVCGTYCDGKKLYVTTRCKECPVAVFDMEGHFIKVLGSKIPFGRVHGIWKDSLNRIFIADDGAHVIRCIDDEDNLLYTIGNYNKPSDTGFDSSIEGHLAYLSVKKRGLPFNKPTRMIEGNDGFYYASDGYGNAAIHKFDRDFNLIKSWGWPGKGPGEFSIVHSVNMDKYGRVFVADRDNDRIQVFNNEGEYLQTINNLLYPCDLDINDEYIYVAENDGRISIYNMDLTLIAQFAHSGSEWRGHSISVDESGNIYLGTLHGNYNLVKFENCSR